MSSGIDGILYIYTYMHTLIYACICGYMHILYCYSICGMSLSCWYCDTAVTMSTFNLTKFSYGAKSNYNIVFRRAPFLLLFLLPFFSFFGFCYSCSFCYCCRILSSVVFMLFFNNQLYSSEEEN